MSDQRPQPDELVSAYLDGEATPAEITEVTSDDALLARVEQLRAARDAAAAPVPPLSAARRDRMISAALAAADAEADARPEAEVVPLRRPQRALLAVAAAVLVLGAVVSAGLIAGRGDDDTAETAADEPAMAAPAEAGAAAEAAAEEPMDEGAMAGADFDTMEMAATTTTVPSFDAAMADEEPMAEEELMAGDAMESSAEEAPAEAEPEAAADDSAVPTTEAGDGDRTLEVVDLGTLETFEALFSSIGASWSAALEGGAMAVAGPCSEAVQQHALELGTETLRSFAATVGVEDPLAVDAGFARRADGTSIVVYAAPPGCGIQVHELDGS